MNNSVVKRICSNHSSTFKFLIWYSEWNKLEQAFEIQNLATLYIFWDVCQVLILLFCSMKYWPCWWMKQIQNQKGNFPSEKNSLRFWNKGLKYLSRLFLESIWAFRSSTRALDLWSSACIWSKSTSFSSNLKMNINFCKTFPTKLWLWSCWPQLICPQVSQLFWLHFQDCF